MAAASRSPIVVFAAAGPHPLPAALRERGYTVAQAPTAALAVAWAGDLAPDVVVLHAVLPDRPGIEACRALHANSRFARHVPILILAAERPAPEERVAALEAGAWEFLRESRDADELALTVDGYVRAKRNIDTALAEGLADTATGLYTVPGFARRAREVSALMARRHGALGCAVFALSGGGDDRLADLVARSARASDVVGIFAPGEFAVLAPDTGPDGVTRLAHRLRDALQRGGVIASAGRAMHAGFDAVANLTYTPVDPIELLRHARAAVLDGVPQPDAPWLRRFAGQGPAAGDPGAPISGPHSLSSTHTTSSGWNRV